MDLGIQLYTIRAHTGDEQFRDALQRVSDMGFQGVELAWKYGGMQPKELARFLTDLELRCCGLHLQLSELLDPNHLVYTYALACRSSYVTTSLCDRVEQFRDLVPALNEAGRIAAAKGLRFTYHNHHQEFTTRIDDVSAQDYLTANTDPETVALEIDLGWVSKGGLDPMAYWRRQAARTPQIHLRDYSLAEARVVDIGDGFIDLDAIVRQAEESGLDWLIYEQDNYPVSAFDSCLVCAERARDAGILPRPEKDLRQ